MERRSSLSAARGRVHRRPYAEAALAAAGEPVPQALAQKRWLPFGPGYATEWPPASEKL